MISPKTRPLFTIGQDRYDHLEVAKSGGPIDVGDLGDSSFGDTFGYNWVAWIDADGVTHLSRILDDGNIENHDLSIPVVIPTNAEHIGLCFDPAGFPIFCWEVAGQVYVTNYDGILAQYVIEGPWAGVDPILLMDSEASNSLAAGQAHLIYLNTDRDTLYTRLQAETYVTERLLLDVENDPARVPAGLAAAPYYLSTPSFGGFTYQIALIDQTGTKFYLYSEIYPTQWQNYNQVNITMDSGLVKLVVKETPVDGGASNSTITMTSALIDTVVFITPFDGGASSTEIDMTSAVVDPVIISIEFLPLTDQHLSVTITMSSAEVKEVLSLQEPDGKASISITMDSGVIA